MALIEYRSEAISISAITLFIKKWRERRKARLEIATMTYQELKDLGFPAVFDNEVIAPGRRSDS